MQYSPKSHSPFSVLGNHLRLLRENCQESVAEVSDAIEIETNELEQIEKGERRPDETILSLLITHFAIQDHEATQLWESAGYDDDTDGIPLPNLSDLHSKTTMILLALDIRALYSDGFTLSANNLGVIMNFTQTADQNQLLSLSRVGMSYAQAEEILKQLERAVLSHRYLPKQRLLPPGTIT